jgi:hypothetical protein
VYVILMINYQLVECNRDAKWRAAEGDVLLLVVVLSCCRVVVVVLFEAVLLMQFEVR